MLIPCFLFFLLRFYDFVFCYFIFRYNFLALLAFTFPLLCLPTGVFPELISYDPVCDAQELLRTSQRDCGS